MWYVINIQPNGKGEPNWHWSSLKLPDPSDYWVTVVDIEGLYIRARTPGVTPVLQTTAQIFFESDTYPWLPPF